jgi:integrase/recombinase XerD
VLYSTGIRRMEVIALKLYDLSLDRGVLLVRQGKGKKDRYVPIGERAIAWVQKYIDEARPLLALEPDDMTVFLTAQGEPFSPDHMTSNVKARIDAAKLGKTGACHLFRHTMATLMHENGADIRFIQETLGHVKLETTQIYTHVSIRTLQQVHATTHPAAHLGRNENAPRKTPDPEAEQLFQMLAEEAENDKE